VRLSLSEISTVGASFEEDVAAYSAAGFGGIGIWEFKLPADDTANVTLLRAAGLAVANEPESVLVITGPLGDAGSQDLVVEGLREIAAAAADAGVRLGLEPIHPSQSATVSFVNSIHDALALLDEAGLGEVGIMADTYNLWEETPAALAPIAPRVTGLHIADVPAEPGRTDRVLPGEGGLRSAALVRALAGAGWDGFLDVEIFSTPDLFWSLPVAEAARQAYAFASTLHTTAGPTPYGSEPQGSQTVP